MAHDVGVAHVHGDLSLLLVAGRQTRGMLDMSLPPAVWFPLLAGWHSVC